MPPIGLLLGNVDFTNLFVVIKEGPFRARSQDSRRPRRPGRDINYGRFINTIITFLIVAFSVFLLVRG